MWKYFVIWIFLYILIFKMFKQLFLVINSVLFYFCFLYNLAVDIFESAFYTLRIILFPSIISCFNHLSLSNDFPFGIHSQFYFLSLGLWLAPQKALWLKNIKWEVVFSGFVKLFFSFSIPYIFKYLFFL